MRVLVFLHSFEPGGVERVALRLCKAWIASGTDVSLVLGRLNGAMKCEADALPYRVLSDGRVPTAAWETLWMILRLPGVIRRERPDVLFCAGNSYTIVSVMMRVMMGRACPPIVAKISNDLARNDFPQPIRWIYHRWLRIQARYINRFVGMAPPMRAEIAAAMGIDPSKVWIVDDPALSMTDIDRFAGARIKGGARSRFVAAGRLVPQKNFSLLLRAFAMIARDDDRLVVLGEGPERGTLERLAEALGIDDRVDFAGHVADLAPWFAEADIFALSSDYEGVPAVIAEALAAGLAIAATDSSVSMGDMLADGRFGMICAPKDVNGFARALDSCRTMRLDIDAMRSQAERFTVERAASHYLAIFAESVGQLSSLTPAGKGR
ncbi:MAG: glycosyltransferase [Sphingomonadales bacterium]|nr:glycosyltransferase [Sphingomonadales bacterium]